jgi:cytochrome c-type biogenesis protein CcmH/NrfG
VSANLEEERDFLLKSLDDLEHERAAGGIDNASYRALHDDYTARAAAVIRALRDGVDTRPEQEERPAPRRWLVVGGLVAFAVIAGVVLAFALGARLPGETSSGNTESPNGQPSASDRRERVERAVAANPDDVPSRLLLAQYLEADDDLAAALRQYDEIIRIDPGNAEAHAQSGRILYLTATAADATDAADLVDASRARLDKAVELDPELADARFFRAIVLANEYGDFAAAQGDLQRYLVAQPEGTFADQARQLLVDVTAALESPPPSTP